MVLFLKLLLAHLIGDFLLQSEKSVQNKEQEKLRSPYLYSHVAFHGIATALILWSIEYWLGILIIIVTHFLIDGAKLTFQKKKNQQWMFFLDQLLHVLVLGGVWYIYEGSNLDLSWFGSELFLLSIVCIYFLTQPASIYIMVMISKWAPQTGEDDNESLDNAGKMIGILERLFVFGFVVTGNWEAIGFLIAAKSVFRFGDLKKSKDRKLTEYILIGTLLSFGIAILTAYAYLYLWGIMSP